VLKQEECCQSFGCKVRKYREKIGVSQEDFAELAGMHRTYIGGIERGERNPTLTTIIKIAKALKIQPETLIAGKATENQ